MPPLTRRTARVVRTVAAVAVAVLVVGGSGYAVGASTTFLRPTETRQNLPVGAANPFIASGTSKGGMVNIYTSSGTGPGALNTAAPTGTVDRYVDPAQFPGGTLTPGVTITEAQGLNTLARIGDNLASVGLSFDDVITMRVFLDNAPGTEVADFAGFNRAYRQYFANVDLVTGATIPQPIGTAAPTTPIVVNDVRPSRSMLEVATLPVQGWLVEIEVDAVLPRGGR